MARTKYISPEERTKPLVYRKGEETESKIQIIMNVDGKDQVYFYDDDILKMLESLILANNPILENHELKFRINSPPLKYDELINQNKQE